MILYKYVPFAAGNTILESNGIGFSQPKFFNDPFDLPSYPVEKCDNSAEDIFERIHLMIKGCIWSKNTGILSMTRTPTNPLMWAHYADKHKGMVIGIDVIAAGLTLEEKNLIPAQYGSVIYVSKRLNEPFIAKPATGLLVGATHHFPHDHYEKLQRLFLHKPLCWFYEEEVRIVKCLEDVSREKGDTRSGHFEIVDTNGRDLYVLSLPRDSIKELYFGIRADVGETDALFYKIEGLHPQLLVYKCMLNRENLNVGFARYSPIAESG
jgi:Protein of unknown function (DUF2971)